MIKKYIRVTLIDDKKYSVPVEDFKQYEAIRKKALCRKGGFFNFMQYMHD